MEEDQRTFYYKGFVLLCEPMRLKSGGFRVNVVICRPENEEFNTFEVTQAESPDGVLMISEEVAVEYAKSWAVEWVDGQRSVL